MYICQRYDTLKHRKMNIRPFAFLRSVVVIIAAISMFSCENPNTGTQDEPYNEPQHQNLSFDFTGTVANHTQLKTNILPKDKELEYVVLLSEKKHFLMNNIDTREELIEDDYNYISGLSQMYGISIRDFLSGMGWLNTGDKEGYQAINLYPNTEYVVYCYGVALDGDGYEAVTEVNYVVVKTTAPALMDVSFDIQDSVEGNAVSITIDPKEYAGLYYSYIITDSYNYYIHPGMEFSEEYIHHYRNRAFVDFNELINNQGVAAEQFCHSGVKTIKQTMEPNTNYQIIVFAVTEAQMPLLCSLPEVHSFATEDVKMSDLTIDISVTDITPYTAELTITPSNNNEEYACVFLGRSQVPNYEDEYQLMEAIISDYMPAIFKGRWSEQLMPLMPNTEYCVIAFGVDNNNPTTHIFRYDFTSEAAEEGKIKVESIDIVKLFDASEIIALDPSYRNALAECECVAVVEMKTSSPASGLYFWWYEEWMSIEYSDEAFMEDLLMYDPSDNPTIMDMYYSMSEDDRFLFAGIAEDEAGNMSPLYYGEPFTLSKEQCDPAEEFFQYVWGTRSQSCVIIGR